MNPMSTSAHEENLLSAIGAQTQAITAVAKEAYAQGRREGQRELLAALKYMVDVFHDDPESGQSMQHAAIEQAQDAIERATTP